MNNFGMMKNLLDNPNKESFCDKELSPKAQRAIPYRNSKRIINIKLPCTTTNKNGYIPQEIIDKYYDKEFVSYPYWYEEIYNLKREYQPEMPAYKSLPTIKLEVPTYEHNREAIITYLKKYIKENNIDIVSKFIETYA